VHQQSGRGIVLHDLRPKKIKADSVKAEKLAPAVAAKKEDAPKRPLVNSVFNLARQS
jgi:Rrf2 family iron-sulfur cluster assembly transcriptional regulator